MLTEYKGRRENEFLHDTTSWKIQKDDDDVLLAFDGEELKKSLSEVLSDERCIVIVGIQVCQRIDMLFKQTNTTTIREYALKDIVAASLWDCGHYQSGKDYILKHFSK